MENISPYASEQLLVNAFTNNKECNANYSYAIHDEKNLLQWDISMPIFDDVNINVFKKLIKHTSYNYLLITKLIYAKSGELVYEGKSQGYVDYRAEKVTIGIKMYELKTGFLVEDFLVTSTRKPIEHKDNVGEIHKIPTFLKSPISRAVNKGFNKIANHSKCE